MTFAKNEKVSMNEFAALRVFAKVVEAGSLSAAGRVLGISPSSVSRRIHELETELGVQLLYRTTRQLSLTEAGEIYYERTQGILESLTEAKLAVSSDRAAPNGLLRLTAPTFLATLHIIPALAALQTQYPSIRVALSVTDRLVDIVGEGYDVAIRSGRLEDSSLKAKKLGESRRIVCASPSYLEHAGVPERPEQLVEHACVTFRHHLGTSTWVFSCGRGTHEVRVRGDFCTDNGGALVAAATNGLGVVLVPRWLASDAIQRGELVHLLQDYELRPATTPLYAVWAPGSHTPPKVRVFVDFLMERFAHDDAWLL